MAENFSETLDTLQETDAQLATHTARIFQVATRIVPSLKKVKVLPLDAQGLTDAGISYMPMLRHYPDGLMTVTFGTDLDQYRDFTEGHFSSRLAPHRAILAKAGVDVTTPAIIDMSYAHELGHARQLAAQQKALGIEAAHAAYSNRTAQEYASLPLSTYTSDAIEQRQTSQQWQEYSETDFAEKVANNICAYEQLPLERDADNFAMRIIREVYES